MPCYCSAERALALWRGRIPGRSAPHSDSDSEHDPRLASKRKAIRGDRGSCATSSTRAHKGRPRVGMRMCGGSGSGVERQTEHSGGYGQCVHMQHIYHSFFRFIPRVVIIHRTSGFDRHRSKKRPSLTDLLIDTVHPAAVLCSPS